MIEDARDRAVFFNPAEFGTAATWTRGGVAHPVSGIFTAAHLAALEGDFGGVSTAGPVLTLAEAAIPTGAAAGDPLTIGASGWRVRDIQPDGSGLARVILERA